MQKGKVLITMKRDTSIRWIPTKVNLTNINVIVVGGTGGIGRAISNFMASRGAQVTVVGQTFRDIDPPNIAFIKADLSLMKEAKRIAALLPAETADLVIFTAGIFAAPKRQETSEKIERDMAVSYLNRFVILREIAPRLGKARSAGQSKPRVFNMAFPGSGKIGNPHDLNAEKEYKVMDAHMNTVAANEALVLDATRRYSHIDTFGLNPGFVKTNIRSNFMGGNKLFYNFFEWLIGLFTPTADQYAERIIPLLVSADIESHGGAMFNRKGEAILPSEGMTESHVKAFAYASEVLATKAGLKD